MPFGDILRPNEIGQLTQKVLKICRELSQGDTNMQEILAEVHLLDCQEPFVSDETKVSNIIAWAMDKEIRVGDTSSFVRRGIGMLLEQDAFEACWLEELFPPDQPSDATQRILQHVDALSSDCGSELMLSAARRISHYFNQLMQYEEEECQLTTAEKVSLSFFIAMRFAASDTPPDIFEGYQAGLPRSLYRDYPNGCVFILSRDSVPVKIEKASWKVVTSGLGLSSPPDSARQVIAEARNRCSSDFGAIQREFDIQEEVYNINPTGIWPIWSRSIEEPFVSCIMPWGTPVAEFVRQKIPLSHEQLVDIMSMLCEGLCTIHSTGRIHGDIKSSNVLLAKTFAGFIDFGFCFREDEEIPPIFQRGFYGSVRETPPEFVGQKGTVHLEAVEMFALGNLFFLLAFRKAPSWWQITNKYSKAFSGSDSEENIEEDIVMSDSDHAQMVACIIKEVEEPWHELSTREERTLEEDIHFFVYSLLRLAPLDRLTSRKALDTLLVFQK